MVSDSDRWKSIITDEVKGSGFYSRQAYIYMSPYSGGQRSTVVSGYYYYPEVALFIDNGTSPTTYNVGDKFNRGSWVAKRVLKNLKYSAVFKSQEVQWTDEQGMLDEDGCFQDAGEYTVTAKWNGLEATKTVKVI